MAKYKKKYLPEYIFMTKTFPGNYHVWLPFPVYKFVTKQENTSCVFWFAD